MSASSKLEDQLNNLSLAQDEEVTKPKILACLEALSDYSVSRRSVSLAYAYLAKNLLAPSASTSANSKREETLKIITEYLDSWLAETSFLELVKAFGALTIILETDRSAFEEILQRNTIQEKIIDAGDTITMEYKIVDPEEYKRVKTSFAIFISQAAASATQLARQLANPRDNRNWLYNRFKDNQESKLCRIAACVAFIKFKGVADPSTTTRQTANVHTATSAQQQKEEMKYPPLGELIDLAKSVSSPVELKDDSVSEQSVQLALEALGVATVKPSARRILATDLQYIKKLLDLGKTPHLQFSTAVIWANLATYPKPESDDDSVKAGLRKYAAKTVEPDEEPESIEEMERRCKAFLGIGVTTTAVAYAKSNSVAVRRLSAQVLLGLAEDRRHRGVMLQQGGAKAALEIVLRSTMSQKKESPTKEDYVAVQVLAKFLITANPLHVFGPTPQSPLLIATLAPLSVPILHEGSSLLQRFESLMALTNVTGLSEELQERVASQSSFLDRLEDIILDGSSETDGMDGRSMCRRAAVELLCNLASCETAFIRYTAIDQEADVKTGHLPGPVASRIDVLLALADADDLPTRQAATGALATFTLASTVGNYIAFENKRISKLLLLFKDRDTGMQLRAVECAKNVGLVSNDQQKAELQASLRKVKSNAHAKEVGEAIQEALARLG